MMRVWMVAMVGCLAIACGSSEPEEDSFVIDSDCEIGQELCPCTDGGSCDAGLECSDDLCVAIPCPVGSEGCPCTSGGVCDGALECESDTCVEPTPDPVCGNGVQESGEGCDDGNQVTEVCDYGLGSCTVCNSNCRSVAGETRVCGDGVANTADGEACDVPGDSALCEYGEASCTVCTDACESAVGVARVCGDSTLDSPYEDCDGESYCLDTCDFLGEAFEPNTTLSAAVELQPANVTGLFSHGPDVVHGPGASSNPSRWQSPDTFALDDVCNGGTFHARIDFDRSQGTLDLLVGRRPQRGGSSTGPPPVTYSWVSDSINDDFQEITISAPEVGEYERTHYIEVRAHDSSNSYIINTYTLSGSVTGCP